MLAGPPGAIQQGQWWIVQPASC